MGVDAEKVDAATDDGVVSLRIPLPEDVKNPVTIPAHRRVMTGVAPSAGCCRAALA